MPSTCCPERQGSAWTAAARAPAAPGQTPRAVDGPSSACRTIVPGWLSPAALLRAIQNGGHRQQARRSALPLRPVSGLAQMQVLELEGSQSGALADVSISVELRPHKPSLGSPFPDGAALLRSCEELKLEGIVSKRADRPYRAGPSRDWLKSKCSGWKAANQERWRMFQSQSG